MSIFMHLELSFGSGSPGKPHFYRAAAPSMCPSQGIYGATPLELFWECCGAFPAVWCCQLGRHWTAGRNPLLERGSEEEDSPGMLEVVPVGGRRSSWILPAPAQGWGCVCAALPGVATIPPFLELLPPVLIFPLETRSVLLIIINYHNNEQIISLEQKLLLPAAFSWEGQWRMNQEREWPFLNVTCQHSERLVVTVPCRARPLFDSTHYSLSFLPKSEFFLGWAKSRAKQATAKYP